MLTRSWSRVPRRIISNVVFDTSRDTRRLCYHRYWHIRSNNSVGSRAAYIVVVVYCLAKTCILVDAGIVQMDRCS